MCVAHKVGVEEAVVLVGGLGTRLRPVINSVPKPMAPICGRPFLAYLLDRLRACGVQRVVLATGYRHEVVAEYFRVNDCGMSLAYSTEPEPLGTGGGLRRALQLCNAADVLVLNGDTFFAVNPGEMLAVHERSGADITMALKPMSDCSRYGTVMLDGERVVGFGEKSSSAAGFINGGVYIVRRRLFDRFALAERFSFEADFLGKQLPRLTVSGFISTGYFIDIGIPEDYAKAERECSQLNSDVTPVRASSPGRG